MRTTSLSFLARQIQVFFTKSQTSSSKSSVKIKTNEFFNIFFKRYSHLISKITNYFYTKKNPLSHLTSSTIFFLLLSILIPSNKLFFVLSTLFVFVNFTITKSFSLTALFSIIPLGIFSIGQVYTFQILESKFIFSDLYPNGRQILYIVTPLLIVYIASLIHFASPFLRKKIPKFSAVFTFFLIGILLTIISSMRAQNLRTLSVFYSLGRFFAITLFVDSFNYLRTKNKKIKKYVFNTLLSQIIICIIFISIIVFLQFLKRNTLGIHIESIDIVPVFGKGSDENPLQFRPVGLSAHANILANNILGLLTTAVTLSLILFKNKKLIITHSIIKISFIMAILAILLTQSRSAYLALIPFVVILVIYFKKQTKEFIHKLLEFTSKNKLLSIFIFFIASLIIPDRFLLSINSLASGGLNVRKKLNSIAIQIISNNPILGTGVGTFIPEAFKINQLGVMSYFPESVHNGLLLFIAESGLLSLLFFYIGYYLILKKIKESKLSKYKYLIYAGFLGQFIVMMFQPFALLLPLNVLILILLTDLDMI